MRRRASDLAARARERIRAAREQDPHYWPDFDTDREILAHEDIYHVEPDVDGSSEDRPVDGRGRANGANRPPLGSPEPGAEDVDGAVGPGVPAAIAALEAGGPEATDVVAQMRVDAEANRDHFASIGMDLGFVYASGALAPDGEPVEPTDPGTYTPNGRPGARAPHLSLDPDDRRSTIFDHFGSDFVLLVAGPTEPWGASKAVEIPASSAHDKTSIAAGSALLSSGVLRFFLAILIPPELRGHRCLAHGFPR